MAWGYLIFHFVLEMNDNIFFSKSTTHLSLVTGGEIFLALEIVLVEMMCLVSLHSAFNCERSVLETVQVILVIILCYLFPSFIFFHLPI